MDRFIRQLTLSNFMTAVCTVAAVGFVTETVYANDLQGQLSQLFQSQRETAEAYNARIETRLSLIKKYCPQGERDTSIGCQTMRSEVGLRNNEEEKCARATDKLATAEKNALESCAKAGFSGNIERCYKSVKACDSAEAELAELQEEDEGGSEQYCNRVLANSCPAIPQFNLGRDYRQEKKDAESDRKETKKDLASLMDEKNDIQKELRTKQRELQEQQQKDAKDAHDAEVAIGNKLEDALEAIGEQQTKAFADARAEYESLDMQLLKMQQDERDAANAIADVEEQQQTQCRAAAEKKYDQAEKARLAAAALKSKNKGSGAAVSGSTKRARNLADRSRAIDYNAYFNECMQGISAEGRSTINAISQAKRAYDSKKKTLDAQAILVEKRRAAITEQLKTMEKTASTQQDKIVSRLNQQLQSLYESRQLTAQQNQARMLEFQQEQAAALSSVQQKIDSTNQELIKTEQEAALAAGRVDCLGRNAQRSESARDRISEGFSSSMGDIKAVEAQCKVAKASCGDTEGICDAVAKIVKDIDLKTGKPVKPKSFDVESSSGRSTR